MLIQHLRCATNPLVLLTTILLLTSAIDVTNIRTLSPFEDSAIHPDDCREILARLPSAEISVPRNSPARTLTRTSPFLPGGLFRHGSCVIELSLLRESDRFVEHALAPVLREHNAFTIWDAMRLAVEIVLDEFTDQTGAGGYLELYPSEEYDGPIGIEVCENDVSVGDYAAYRYLSPSGDLGMMNMYEFDW